MEERLNEIEKDLSKYSSLAALKDSEGGKILIEALEKDCMTTIDEIRLKCREVSHIELIALCLRLNEKLNVLKILNNAENNRNLTKEEYDRITKG